MKTFIDTNIWVHAQDPRDPTRRGRAIEAIRAVPVAERVLSTQVLQEFYRVLHGKLGMPGIQVKLLLPHLQQGCEVVTVTPAIVEHGIDLHLLHDLHFWDGILVAAAVAADCRRLLSEDFADGAQLEGLRVVSPFA